MRANQHADQIEKNPSSLRKLLRHLRSVFAIEVIVDPKEKEISSRIFKRTEAIFKVASWISLVGLFKLLQNKTGSWPAVTVYVFLNGTLFVYLLSLLEPFNLKILSENKTWKKNINIAVTILLFMIFFFAVLNPAINSVVSDISKSR
jgi:hypothetical protein